MENRCVSIGHPLPVARSPPPHCAICLADFRDKCCSNACDHEFCFSCLVQWSKIKAECPLCKKTFNSIIHNIKSKQEFEEYVIDQSQDSTVWSLPNQSHEGTVWRPPDDYFDTMYPQWDLPIGNPPAFTDRFWRYPRPTRSNTATAYRRSIYEQNLWVYAPPDLTGRYRDCTPTFFRENPSARGRLIPWLNRELNALLFENTQLIMEVVDIILQLLLVHHICTRTFRERLRVYLNRKTDHFVHEFYNFMRSPFDVIGYDRHIIYSDRPLSPTSYVECSDDDDDDDVMVIDDEIRPSRFTTRTGVSSAISNEPIVILDTDSETEPALERLNNDGEILTAAPTEVSTYVVPDENEPIVVYDEDVPASNSSDVTASNLTGFAPSLSSASVNNSTLPRLSERLPSLPVNSTSAGIYNSSRKRSRNHHKRLILLPAKLRHKNPTSSLTTASSKSGRVKKRPLRRRPSSSSSSTESMNWSTSSLSSCSFSPRTLLSSSPRRAHVTITSSNSSSPKPSDSLPQNLTTHSNSCISKYTISSSSGDEHDGESSWATQHPHNLRSKKTSKRKRMRHAQPQVVIDLSKSTVRHFDTPSTSRSIRGMDDRAWWKKRRMPTDSDDDTTE